MVVKNCIFCDFVHLVVLSNMAMMWVLFTVRYFYAETNLPIFAKFNYFLLSCLYDCIKTNSVLFIKYNPF